jgi:hypothetical protein
MTKIKVKYLQNELIKPEINDKTIYNKIIETLFYNHIQLHKSRRIKNKEQEVILLKMKQFIFKQFDTLPRNEFINILQNNFNIKVNKSVNYKQDFNITFYNHTAERICQNALVEIKKKKVVYKKFNWYVNIDCFVKQRFKTKSNMFQSNYVYKIVDLDKIKEIATLKDVFTKEQHIISLK